MGEISKNLANIKVSELVEILQNDLSEKRQYAIDELIKIGTPALPDLIKSIKVGNRNYQRLVFSLYLFISHDKWNQTEYKNCLWTFLSVKNDNVVNFLLETLRSSRVPEVIESTRILGYMQERRAVGPISVLLRHPDDRVKVTAIKSLARIGDKSTENVLRKIAKHDRSLSETANKAIQQIRTGKGQFYSDIPPYIDKGTFQQCLVNLKGHPQDGVMRKSIDQLASQGDRSIVPLIELMRDSSKNARDNAAITLIKIGTPAVTQLMELMRDPGYQYKPDVVRALGFIGDRRSTVLLLEHLKDDDVIIRRASLDALKSFRYRIEPGLLKDLADDPDAIMRKNALKLLYQSIQNDAADTIIKALQDSHPDVRLEAVKLLGQVKRPGLVIYLTELLHDEDIDIRRQTIESLGMITDPVAIRPLAAMLLDGSKLDADIIKSLKMINDKNAVLPLCECLEKVENHVKSNAIIALGDLKDPRAIPYLLKMLWNTDQGVRQNAINALLQFDRVTLFEVLSGALENARAPKKHIIEAMKIICPTEATAYMITALEENDPDIKTIATHTLVMADASALSQVVARFNINNPSLNKALYNILAKNKSTSVAILKDQMEKSPAGILIYFIRLLEVIGGDEAIDIIIRQTGSDEQIIRQVAFNVYTNLMKPKKEYVHIANASRFQQYKTATLNEFMVQMLRDKRFDCRREAILVLGYIDDGRAIPELIKCLDDTDNTIRKYAAMSLGNLKAEEAIQPLISKLARNGMDAQIVASDALISIGDTAIGNLIMALYTGDKIILDRVSTLLISFGEIALPQLKAEQSCTKTRIVADRLRYIIQRIEINSTNHTARHELGFWDSAGI
jgi:HEAT repeat protein